MSAGREFQRRQGLALKAHHGNPVHNLRLIRRYRHDLAAVDQIHMSAADIGCYVRPEAGNLFLIGSEDPDCDPQERVDPDTARQHLCIAVDAAGVFTGKYHRVS